MSRKVTRKRTKHKKGGGKRRRTGNKNLLVKLQTKNMKVLDACKKTATNKYQEKKCLDNFDKTWGAYSVFLRDNGNKVFTPKQQREVMKKFFGKSKKGGSTKKMNTSEFKKFLLGKEQEYMNKKTTCNKTCSKIRTNYAKNKKKLTKQKKCYATCEKERLTNIQKIHKQYPKEFKQFIKNM